MIQAFLLERGRTFVYASNFDLRCLRALFNFGIKKRWILTNPTQSISFLPVEKKVKYIPPKENVLRVIITAAPDTQDYLWTIIYTMGRISEINRLTWKDVNFDDRYIVLHTRKKKGGHLTPRKVPMPQKLYEILYRKYSNRDKNKPWVFWHIYTSRKTGERVEGPYKDRKRIMKTLCQKAGVRYFRYHALRHLGASILDHNNENIGSIQRILGHESRSTTEIYLHSIGGAERDAMEAFESVWAGYDEKIHTQIHTQATNEG